MKNIFKTTKNLLNWKEGGTPQSFLVDGNLVRRPVDLANFQMDYFTEKISKLTRILPNETTNPLKWFKLCYGQMEGEGESSLNLISGKSL